MKKKKLLNGSLQKCHDKHYDRFRNTGKHQLSPHSFGDIK
uniref:Uncharacterized protein n=1 Tax=Arundo donax TaxID=35708 RepID=A0A0A8Z4Z8_ARUDO